MIVRRLGAKERWAKRGGGKGTGRDFAWGNGRMMQYGHDVC